MSDSRGKERSKRLQKAAAAELLELLECNGELWQREVACLVQELADVVAKLRYVSRSLDRVRFGVFELPCRKPCRKPSLEESPLPEGGSNAQLQCFAVVRRFLKLEHKRRRFYEAITDAYSDLVGGCTALHCRLLRDLLSVRAAEMSLAENLILCLEAFERQHLAEAVQEQCRLPPEAQLLFQLHARLYGSFTSVAVRLLGQAGGPALLRHRPRLSASAGVSRENGALEETLPSLAKSDPIPCTGSSSSADSEEPMSPDGRSRVPCFQLPMPGFNTKDDALAADFSPGTGSGDSPPTRRSSLLRLMERSDIQQPTSPTSPKSPTSILRSPHAEMPSPHEHATSPPTEGASHSDPMPRRERSRTDPNELLREEDESEHAGRSPETPRLREKKLPKRTGSGSSKSRSPSGIRKLVRNSFKSVGSADADDLADLSKQLRSRIGSRSPRKSPRKSPSAAGQGDSIKRKSPRKSPRGSKESSRSKSPKKSPHVSKGNSRSKSPSKTPKNGTRRKRARTSSGKTRSDVTRTLTEPMSKRSEPDLIGRVKDSKPDEEKRRPTAPFQMPISAAKVDQIVAMREKFQHIEFEVGGSDSPRRRSLAKSTSMSGIDEASEVPDSRTSTTGVRLSQRVPLSAARRLQDSSSSHLETDDAAVDSKKEQPERGQLLKQDSVSRSFSLGDMRQLSMDDLDATERRIAMSARNPLKDSRRKKRYDGTNLVAPSDTHWLEVGNPTDISLELPEDDEVTTTLPPSLWYREFFVGSKHSNYLIDLPDNDVAVVSVVKEREQGKRHYRVLVRTNNNTSGAQVPSSLLPLHVVALSSISLVRALVHFVDPMLSSRKSIRKCEENVTKQLAEFEELEVSRIQQRREVKAGVLYWCVGNRTEEDMYSNTVVTPAFAAFLRILGSVISLKDWAHYAGGLDTAGGCSGQEAVYTTFEEREFMFHVGPLLPQSEKNRQQIEKKRHIGNDVVVIIFKEDPAPYLVSTVASQFNHVVIVVSSELVEGSETDSGGLRYIYRVNVCAQLGVPPFKPPLPPGGLFTSPAKLRTFLLQKIVAGESAAVHAPAFSARLTRTRRFFLRSMAVVD